MSQSFSLQARLKSFGYALNGIGVLFREQHNAWLHLLAMCGVIALGLWLQLLAWEWVAIILTIAMVLAAEALNTAVEYVADACMPDQHPLIGKAKDVAAGAVLLTAVAAMAIAVIIFYPYLKAGA